MELWEGGRFKGESPAIAPFNARIEVWFNWELVGAYKSYAEARAKVSALLKTAPTSLHDLVQYLDLRIE